MSLLTSVFIRSERMMDSPELAFIVNIFSWGPDRFGPVVWMRIFCRLVWHLKLTLGLVRENTALSLAGY